MWSDVFTYYVIRQLDPAKEATTEGTARNNK